MAVILKKMEHNDQWHFSIVKLSPEIGDENTKQGSDWSGRCYATHRYNIKKDLIDIDGQTIILTIDRGASP